MRAPKNAPTCNPFGKIRLPRNERRLFVLFSFSLLRFHCFLPVVAASGSFGIACSLSAFRSNVGEVFSFFILIHALAFCSFFGSATRRTTGNFGAPQKGQSLIVISGVTPVLTFPR